jgi:urease accessory protein
MAAIAPVITAIIGTQAELAEQIQTLDPLRLTSEERLSPHGVYTTAGGQRLRISLPRSAELLPADVLMLEQGCAVIVEAAPEALLVITPGDTPLTWGIVGFQLGNLHRPVRFTENTILTPADAIAAEMLQRLAIPFEQTIAPFIGQRHGSKPAAHHAHGGKVGG